MDFFRPPFSPLLLLGLLLFPALTCAFPADSLLLVDVTELSPDSIKLGSSHYEYTPSIDQLVVKRSDYRDDSLKQVETMTYDAKGREIKSDLANAGGTFHKIIDIEYNADSNPIKETTHQGTATQVLVKEYDASKRATKWTWTGADGKVGWVQTFEYGLQGQLLKTNHIEKDSVTEFTEYAYDGLGRKVIAAELKPPHDTLYYDTFEYDSLNQLVYDLTTYTDTTLLFLNSTRAIGYDSLGNMESEHWFDADGNLQWYKLYQYQTISFPVALRERPLRRMVIRENVSELFDLLGRPDRNPKKTYRTVSK